MCLEKQKRKTKMKKIMIACAAVAMAAVAQAASIDWNVSQNWTLADGDKAALGTTIYLIDAAYADSLAAAIGKDGTIAAGTQGLLGSATTSNARGKVDLTTTTHDGLTAGKSYDFAVLIVDKTDANQMYYAISQASSQNAYTVGKDEALSISFTSTTINGTGAISYANGTAWQAVPEPTSGLLMLVGLAGLALRRRRA
jgi:hypothetical protein